MKKKLLTACLTGWLAFTGCDRTHSHKPEQQLETVMMESCVQSMSHQLKRGGFIGTPPLYHTEEEVPVFVDRKNLWSIDEQGLPVKQPYVPGALAESIITTYEANQAAHQKAMTGLDTTVDIRGDIIHIKNHQTAITVYGSRIEERARLAEDVIRTQHVPKDVIKTPTADGYLLDVDGLRLFVASKELE